MHLKYPQHFVPENTAEIFKQIASPILTEAFRLPPCEFTLEHPPPSHQTCAYCKSWQTWTICFSNCLLLIIVAFREVNTNRIDNIY